MKKVFYKLWLASRGMIYMSICILMLMVIVHYNRLGKEHSVMTESLSGLGGASEEMKEYKNLRNEWWIKHHGVKNYVEQNKGWIYSELSYPVMDIDKTYIRSEFGWRYIYGKREYAIGTDWVAKIDLRVKASHKGFAKIGLNHRYYGNYIVIDNGVYKTRYSHLSVIYVDDNIEVDQNTIIGIMGNTGRSYGIHLDFEVYINGINVNPFSISTYNLDVVN